MKTCKSRCPHFSYIRKNVKKSFEKWNKQLKKTLFIHLPYQMWPSKLKTLEEITVILAILISTAALILAITILAMSTSKVYPMVIFSLWKFASVVKVAGVYASTITSSDWTKFISTSSHGDAATQRDCTTLLDLARPGQRPLNVSNFWKTLIITTIDRQTSFWAELGPFL